MSLTFAGATPGQGAGRAAPARAAFIQASEPLARLSEGRLSLGLGAARPSRAFLGITRSLSPEFYF